MPIVYHAAIPNSPGVYCIRNTVTKRVYVGSAKNLRERCREHFRYLQSNTHCNQKLQRAFNKYAPETFVFEVLEFILLPEMLTAREQYWMDKLQAVKKGFNILPIAGSTLGMKASPETIERLRVSHIGQPSYWTGKKRPDIGPKISAATLGKPRPHRPGYTHSASHRENIRLKRLGTTASDEAKRHMAEAQTGRKQSPASIEKTRLSNLGRRNTPEAITGMIAARVKDMKTIVVISPEGTAYTIIGLRQFCKEYGLDRRSMQRVIQGKHKSHKGWRAYPKEDTQAP